MSEYTHKLIVEGDEWLMRFSGGNVEWIHVSSGKIGVTRGSYTSVEDCYKEMFKSRGSSLKLIKNTFKGN